MPQPPNPPPTRPASGANAPADTSLEQHLDRYAQLLVKHALGLQPRQRLDICGEQIHSEFALRVGDAAYAVGAGPIRYRMIDPQATAQLIRRGQSEQIALYHVENQAWLADLLLARGALLILDGWTDPNLFSTLGRSHPHNHQLFAREASAVSLDFTRRALDLRLCPMVRAVCPTPAWAQQVFPELPPRDAFTRLASLLFRFTHADQPQPLQQAAATAQQLEARAKALDALAIRTIHVRGNGNDLRVGFSPHCRWLSASTHTVAGQRFFPNVPSFEVFTSPDRRLTQGRIAASRPIRLYEGVIVRDLVLHFRDGRVTHFEAQTGHQAFARWLDIDDGARYLGEFALVGEDSPIARCGHTFQHPILDENAATHLALGNGFVAALADGGGTKAGLAGDCGLNRSAIHIDIPFGAPGVDMVEIERGREEISLLADRVWSERFRI